MEVTGVELSTGTVPVFEACGKVNVVVTWRLDEVTELVRLNELVVFIATEDEMDVADKLVLELFVLAGTVSVTG
jgi:hypothetical protein